MRRAFFPLTMPLTVGPEHDLGRDHAGHPGPGTTHLLDRRRPHQPPTCGLVTICANYCFAAGVLRILGETGTPTSSALSRPLFCCGGRADPHQRACGVAVSRGK